MRIFYDATKVLATTISNVFFNINKTAKLTFLL